MEINNYYEGDHQFVRGAENLPAPSDLELSALLNINPMDIVNTTEF